MNKHRITFYPIGNADTTLIELKNDKKILFDYADMRCKDDPEDKRIDLPTTLNKSVKGNYYAVCFTHADDDHIHGFSEYFYLEHAAKYQSKDRKKINELWVPAAVLIEEGCDDDAKILRAEARHRLKNKSGIKVFSRAKKMKDWCDAQEDIDYESVKHLFIDAGKLVPGLQKETDGIEFFVHSPFASETQSIDRNREAITVQATFDDYNETKLIMGSDITHDVWIDIVKITKHFKNEARLLWDIFHISHHCSYTALSQEKGKTKTMPVPEVKWLFETQGRKKGRIISPSWDIPREETTQPPHKEAAEYYKSVADLNSGEFLVTMEEPSIQSPEPLVIEIDYYTGAKVIKAAAAYSFVSGKTPPRAG
jgi:hypothetical protein